MKQRDALEALQSYYQEVGRESAPESLRLPEPKREGQGWLSLAGPVLAACAAYAFLSFCSSSTSSKTKAIPGALEQRQMTAAGIQPEPQGTKSGALIKPRRTI